MQTDRVLLDTHVLLWWFSRSELLSQTALAAIEQAEGVLASPISFWEISMLVAKGRVALDRPVTTWVNDVTAASVELAALTAQIAVVAGSLEDFHADPADRLIYSTARVDSLALISKDRRMTEAAAQAGSIEVIW